MDIGNKWINNCHDPPFSAGDYIHVDNVYEDITDATALKKFMQDMLEEYNSTPGVVSMDLVLFRDAIEHG